jgi:hypothetical protein
MADELDAHLLAVYVKLVEELTKVKAQRDGGDDDWEWSFLRVMWKYLEALQVPKELIAPAHAMLLAKTSEVERGRRRRAGDHRTLKAQKLPGQLPPGTIIAGNPQGLQQHARHHRARALEREGHHRGVRTCPRICYSPPFE